MSVSQKKDYFSVKFTYNYTGCEKLKNNKNL